MDIVFDLDGTLADITHRLHFIQRPNKEKDWDSFFKACVDDEPIMPVIKIFQSMRFHHGIQIWSGRSIDVWPETHAWLEKWDIIPDRIRMRPSGDKTPDHELKEEWLKEQIYLRLKPHLVFDDRSRLVEMWRRNGVQCLQVAEGNF